ncbi:MAG: FtsQ-type POTRA domain-containing protein, partial [Gammaproteobacteria bacterium]|nr:FtsQ-type POTRA domain-containing protein [Gammaproteobacteria bacterium]
MPVNSRRNRKRKTKTKRKNPLIKHAVAVRNAWLSISWVRVLTLCTIAAVSVCVYVATLWAMNRPIQAVVIDGAFERVSAIQIEEVLSAHVKTGFLSADLNAMRAQLEDLSWIATAKVRRRWPGSIEVVIDEQLPVARWGDAGLLNVDGELFVEKVNHVPAELPRLQGPADSEK